MHEVRDPHTLESVGVMRWEPGQACAQGPLRVLPFTPVRYRRPPCARVSPPQVRRAGVQLRGPLGQALEPHLIPCLSSFPPLVCLRWPPRFDVLGFSYGGANRVPPRSLSPGARAPPRGGGRRHHDDPRRDLEEMQEALGIDDGRGFWRLPATPEDVRQLEEIAFASPLWVPNFVAWDVLKVNQGYTLSIPLSAQPEAQCSRFKPWTLTREPRGL